MESICNKCEKLFLNNEIKKQNISNGLVRYFIQCPHCSEQYTISYEDREALRLKKSIANIRKQVQDNPSKSEKLMLKYRKLVKKLTKYTDELNKRIEGEV